MIQFDSNDIYFPRMHAMISTTIKQNVMGIVDGTEKKKSASLVPVQLFFQKQK
jgi:hypothetical protein